MSAIDHYTPESAQAELDRARHREWLRDRSPETREKVDQAHELHVRIVRCCDAIRTSWVELAACLDAFMNERGWQILGYDSENAYFDDPDVALSRSHARRLLKCYREFAGRMVSPERLEGVELTKLEVTLPAVKRGDVAIDKAIADTRALSRKDLYAEYQGPRGPDAPLDATAEPPQVECPTCGKWGNPDNFKSWEPAQ